MILSPGSRMVQKRADEVEFERVIREDGEEKEVMKKGSLEKTILILLLLLALALSARAQARGSAVRPALLQEVGIDQKLGDQLPLLLTFLDENGKPVRLADYFHQKPVVLALVYYECPMLCTQVLNGLTNALRTLSFHAGQEFEVIAVSIDPGETPGLAAAKKEEYLKRYSRAETAHGWHFLTGEETAVKRLAKAVGFRYTYDSEKDLYVHASSIMVLTPEGKLARYFYGIEYSPRDLRLSLVEASVEKIGSPIDQLLLFCYHYDPTTGKYGVVIMDVLRLTGTATVLGLGVFIFMMLRRERFKKGEGGHYVG